MLVHVHHSADLLYIVQCQHDRPSEPGTHVLLDQSVGIIFKHKCRRQKDLDRPNHRQCEETFSLG